MQLRFSWYDYDLGKQSVIDVQLRNYGRVCWEFPMFIRSGVPISYFSLFEILIDFSIFEAVHRFRISYFHPKRCAIFDSIVQSRTRGVLLCYIVILKVVMFSSSNNERAGSIRVVPCLRWRAKGCLWEGHQGNLFTIVHRQRMSLL